ncbi:MAG: DUF692 family protein [Xanthobacteraceae bacterium]|nr:DUF692 family protein [Xanthobacteraceae bacterium]
MTTRSHSRTFDADMPVPAVGAGLKPEHAEDIFAGLRRADFFEIHAENYMGAGGPPHHLLQRIRADYPLSIHGVGLSIGGTAPLDCAHLLRLKRLVDVYEPALFSEHLAWSTHDGIFLNDLLPLPYNDISLAHVCDHVNEVQDTLGMRMLLENPSTYITFGASSMTEVEFLRAVARRTGCGLLLDVNNVHVSAVNHGFDLGLAANFYFFSGLNLAGALLVYLTIRSTMPTAPESEALPASFKVWTQHLRNRPLRATFGIGFCILFAFIGTFTYVNFVLVQAPLSLNRMALGLVYFVFLPSIVTTPFAGAVVQRLGTQATIWGALALAGLGLPLLLLPALWAVVLGMMLVGVGTFFAQAAATGFVGRAASADRGAASGIYLACYFAGGLVGSALLGHLFDAFGWPACVLGIALALLAAGILAFRMRLDLAGQFTRRETEDRA